MNKRIVISLWGCMVGLMLWAQAPAEGQRQRTPEEQAHKQTEMLIRELGIQDSMQIDTLYKMHLKYAKMRQQGNTRQQDMERMLQTYEELKHILTADQYNRFMNQQVRGPRRPQAAAVRMPAASTATNDEQQRRSAEPKNRPQ